MAGVLEPSQLLTILESNRGLTVRTIQAFSEEDLFHYTPVAPMRPFADLVREIIGIEDAIIRGIATGEWTWNPDRYKGISTTEELLDACESVRSQTREWWPRLTAERLVAVEQDPWTGTQSNFYRIQYAIENENHHRGQGYVYLRLRGIEPPPFYER